MGSAYDHPDWAGFIAAIRANPADDLPRLVAADWLDEHRERDRAELIRLVIATARDTSDGRACNWAALECDCRRCLRDRQLAVLIGNQHRLTAAPLVGTRSAGWRMGFVESVTCDAADWLAHGDAVLAREPVERVTLTTWPDGSVTKVKRQRAWRQPPRLGGHVLDCWRAEWPGVEFALPPVAVTGLAVGTGLSLSAPAVAVTSDGTGTLPSVLGLGDSRLPVWTGDGVWSANAARFEVAEPLAPGDRAEVGPDGRLRRVG